MKHFSNSANIAYMNDISCQCGESAVIFKWSAVWCSCHAWYSCLLRINGYREFPNLDKRPADKKAMEMEL